MYSTGRPVYSVVLCVLLAHIPFLGQNNPPSNQVASSCVILKRMGPADEVTSHLYSFGLRGKQFQYVEGQLPAGISISGSSEEIMGKLGLG